MVVRGQPLPERLRPDAIVEALFEVQFDTETLPERFIGRISDGDPWKSLPQRKLPLYDMPAAIRLTQLGFKYQPIVEIADTGDTPRALKLGPNVLSYHRQKKYVGWNRFKIELEDAVDLLFSSMEGIKVTRLGLRYLNALTPGDHRINSIHDLDLKIEVAHEQLLGNVNLNYQFDLGNTGQCVVRIATKEFIPGTLPPTTSAYVDVDVFTAPGFTCTDPSEVKAWVEAAHRHEKEEFFHLLKQHTIDQLRE